MIFSLIEETNKWYKHPKNRLYISDCGQYKIREYRYFDGVVTHKQTKYVAMVLEEQQWVPMDYYKTMEKASKKCSSHSRQEIIEKSPESKPERKRILRAKR